MVMNSIYCIRINNEKLQWPKYESEVHNLSKQELRWLLEGLSISQPKAIAKSPKGIFKHDN